MHPSRRKANDRSGQHAARPGPALGVPAALRGEALGQLPTRLVGNGGSFPEIIGWAAPQESSEIIAAAGPVFDADVFAETARSTRPPASTAS